jgi:membrane protease YdiL (CAAX protease family)
MSDINFLDNAVQGKNSWVRYFLTIVISLIGGTFASLLFIVLFMIIYFLSSGISGLEVQTNILNYNPLLILVLVGISYGIYSLLFYLCIRFIHKKKFLSLINTGKNIKWNRILKGAGLWAGIMVIFTLMSLIFQDSNLSLNFNPGSFMLLLILSLLVCPFQASFEEIFFRGYLMQAIGLITKKPVVPLILTSLIFGVIHFFNGTNLTMSITIVVSATILGLMLGIIVLGENGLETAMGAHIANNMYVALVFNTSDSGLGGLPSLITTETTDPLSGIPWLILMASVMIIILFWNKKEDLFRIFR